TSLGERTLEGTEALVFRTALLDLASWHFDVAEDGDETTGIPAFDRLTVSQKIATLELVGRALLQDDVQAPELTCVNEATVAAVFSQIRERLADEIDAGMTNLPTMILSACRDTNIDIGPLH